MAPTKPPAKTAKKRGAPRKATKKAAKRSATKKASRKGARFGRPGTAGKADGDAAVKAWIAAVSPAHRPIVKKLDALVATTVPGVRRAIKWSMPMYGVRGRGWFASVASYKNYVSLIFFRGTALTPPPPLGDSKQMRRVNIRDPSEYDEARFRSWIEQAAAIPGWGKA